MTYGNDDIPVRMVKICDNAIKKALSIIDKNCIKTGIYLNAWKKYNIVQVHQKGDKQIVNNYRPVLLLPIFGKFLRKFYLIPFLDTFGKIAFFVITNQVFNLLIHVTINCFLLFKIFMHLLIVTPQRYERDIS